MVFSITALWKWFKVFFLSTGCECDVGESLGDIRKQCGESWRLQGTTPLIFHYEQVNQGGIISEMWGTKPCIPGSGLNIQAGCIRVVRGNMWGSERCLHWKMPVHGEHFRCGKWGWGIDIKTSQDERTELKESSRSWEFTENTSIISKQQIKLITKW